MTIKEIKPIINMVKRVNEINAENQVNVCFNPVDEYAVFAPIHYCEFSHYAGCIALYSPKIYDCGQAISYLEDLLEAFGMNTSGEVKDESVD